MDDFFDSLHYYSLQVIRLLALVSFLWLWWVDEIEILAIAVLINSLGFSIVDKVILIPLGLLLNNAFDKYENEKKHLSLVQILIIISFLHFLMLQTRSLSMWALIEFGADKMIVNGAISFTSAILPIFIGTITIAVAPWYLTFHQLGTGFLYSLTGISYSLTFLFFSHLAFLGVMFFNQGDQLSISKIKAIIFIIMIILLPLFLTYKIKNNISESS